MNKIFVLFCLLFVQITSTSGQVTWSGDVANIIYTNCSNCHNSNGIGPFTLMSYQDASMNGLGIQSAVEDHIMPPWPPNSAYNRLAHERVLTAEQITTISDWVNNGMLRGDSTQEPAAPIFSSAEEITTPDLTLTIPSFNVNTTSDLYRCFVLPSGLTSLKYLTGLETVPGVRSIVHHVLIYMDTTNVPATLDANDPGPGYTAFGGTGSSASKLIGVWVPGQGAYFAPQGMGIRLPANCSIILQIHYPAGISGQTDATKINIQYTSSFRREIYIEAVLNHYQLDQGFLRIPANTIRTFTANYQLPINISALGVGPHMHLIGKSIRSWAITPTTDTIPFIDIPNWDFHWQGIYSFPRVLKLPIGTTLYSTAFYDNTVNNPNNPNNPPVTVNLGESTTDEMMLIYFAYTNYLPGDENIIIDSTIVTAIPEMKDAIVQTCQLYDPSPNPAVENCNVSYYLPTSGSYTLILTDQQGKIVQELSSGTRATSGFYSTGISVSKFKSGVYYIVLNSNGVSRTKRLVVR